jgi:PAS domain S-box-containing protein
MPANAPVLILAPLGRDAQGMVIVLERQGYSAKPFRSIEPFCQAIGEDTGMLIITEEALTRDSMPLLLSVLEKQPAWSEVPIILLLRPALRDKSNVQISIARMAEELGNVTFLERPLHGLTLASAVRAGLKARKRQFQNRNDALALRESETRYRRIIETANEGVWLLDDQDRTTFVNRQMADMFGYMPEEMLGWTPLEFLPQEEHGRAKDSLGKRRQGINEILELEFICKDNSRICVEMATSSIFDEQGNYHGALALVTDITERKKSQEVLKNYAIRLEESNRELEQFASIASHDLQAPLRKVSLFSEMLERQLDGNASPETFDMLGRIKNSVERMRQLVSDLLQLSRVSTNTTPFEPVNLNAVLETVNEDLLVVREETGGRLEVDLPSTLMLMGNRGQISQVFQNLIQNALKFHRKDVPPVVRVSAWGEDSRCLIAVEDNGIGFKPEYAKKIFETFQRLHGQSEYPGTGIGLSIVKKIVERHLGVIRVDSEPGVGSRFVLDFPAFVPAPESSDNAISAAGARNELL